MNRYIFLRNDDIGSDKDPCIDQTPCNHIPESLQVLVDICVKENVPLTLGVVPKMLNNLHIKWLKTVESDLFEIAQHGYTHKDHGCKEFGSCRKYQDQFNDIKNGLEIMKKSIGRHPKIFIPPNNRYSKDTLKALNELGFTTISAKYKKNGVHGIINKIGKTIGKDSLIGMPVSKQGSKRHGVKETSISIDFTESYNPLKNKSLDKILSEIKSYENEPFIGIMLHHWTLSHEDLKTVKNLVISLKSAGYIFKKLSDF